MSQDHQMTVIEHLQDLRKTLIISISAWLLLTTASYFVFQDKIFDFFTLPLKEMDLKLVILTPFEGFMAKLKAACFAGYFLLYLLSSGKYGDLFCLLFTPRKRDTCW